jgi:hypothetical protein
LKPTLMTSSPERRHRMFLPFFAKHETAPIITELAVPNDLQERFLDQLQLTYRASGRAGLGPEELGIRLQTGGGIATLTYPMGGDAADLVLLAAARTDAGLIAQAAEGLENRRNDPISHIYRGAWVDHLLEGGHPADLAAFSKHEHARLESVGLAALSPVEGGETDRGVWMRVTGRDASLLATRLGETAVSRWIEKRFDGPSEEGEVMPEFYLLIDDPATPTRAHVTLAAAPESDLEAGRQVRMIEPCGHATGFRNENPYPEFAGEIDTLVRTEGLALKPNWMGRVLNPEPEARSDDGPGM